MKTLWRRAFEVALAVAMTVGAGGADTFPEIVPEAPGVKPDPVWERVATESAECTDVFLGEYTLTAYCACEFCRGKSDGVTATGTQATQGRTIAVDPRDIPYGTSVVIILPDGTQHSYVAEDCGGAIKGKRIDIYFDSHADALEFGVRSGMVYEEGKEP